MPEPTGNMPFQHVAGFSFVLFRKIEEDGMKKPGAGLSTCPRAGRGLASLADGKPDVCQVGINSTVATS